MESQHDALCEDAGENIVGVVLGLWMCSHTVMVGLPVAYRIVHWAWKTLCVLSHTHIFKLTTNFGAHAYYKCEYFTLTRVWSHACLFYHLVTHKIQLYGWVELGLGGKGISKPPLCGEPGVTEYVFCVVFMTTSCTVYMAAFVCSSMKHNQPRVV